MLMAPQDFWTEKQAAGWRWVYTYPPDAAVAALAETAIARQSHPRLPDAQSALLPMVSLIDAWTSLAQRGLVMHDDLVPRNVICTLPSGLVAWAEAQPEGLDTLLQALLENERSFRDDALVREGLQERQATLCAHGSPLAR